MYLPNELLITLSLFGFTGFLISAFCYLKLKKIKSLVEKNNHEKEVLKTVFEDYKADLEKNIADFENQTQIIALRSLDKQIELENHRKKELVEKTGEMELEDRDLSKQKMEILSLAGRGEDSRTIAEKLGLMTGEVELIVNLNRTLPGYF